MGYCPLISVVSLTLILPVLLCSCVCVDYGRPAETLRIRLEVENPEDYSIHSSVVQPDVFSGPGQYGGECPLLRDGRDFLLHLPFCMYGPTRVLMIIPVGGASPERSERIRVLKGETSLMTLRVSELRQLPKTADGAYRIDPDKPPTRAKKASRSGTVTIY